MILISLQIITVLHANHASLGGKALAEPYVGRGEAEGEKEGEEGGDGPCSHCRPASHPSHTAPRYQSYLAVASVVDLDIKQLLR